MIVDVKCNICGKSMEVGCVIGGEPPLVSTGWSCYKDGSSISITSISDDKWEEWYCKNKKDTKK